MKLSLLILCLSMIFQSAVFAAPSDTLKIGSRFIVQANTPGGWVYRIVTIVGFTKNGDLFVSGMSGDPSTGLDRIPASQERFPLLAKDCEYEFCTDDQVIVHSSINGVSKAMIYYIDHDKKEAIVSLNNWANYLQRIPLSDILSVPSYGPQEAQITGNNFVKKDVLSGTERASEAESPLVQKLDSNAK